MRAQGTEIRIPAGLTFRGKESIIREYSGVLAPLFQQSINIGERQKALDKSMRRIKKKTKRRLVIGIGGALVILAAVSVTAAVRNLTAPQADTQAGVDYIKAAESEDIAVIEEKISLLERQDGNEDDTRSAKEKFAGTAVMGDSIADGFAQYDVLNASNVVAKNGVELTELDDQIEMAKELDPQILFLCYGMNDVVSTDGDTEQFTQDYAAFLDKLQEEIPDAHIFVNSIFPVQNKAVEEEPALDRIEEYNTALKALCDERQIGFIDNTELVSSQYYAEDGIHFESSFYPVWADHMAEVAAL